MNEIDREARDDREYEFVCDVCKRELYVMPTYDHDQIDGEEWFHKDDETVACNAWEVAPDLYEEVQTARAQLAALRDERDRRWTLEQIESILDYVTTATTFHQNTGEWSGADTVRELKRLFSAHNPDGTYREAGENGR